MKASSHAIAVSRIRKLVLRDTGQVLSDVCALEIATLLSSLQSTAAAASEDDEFQSRDVTILLADLRGFTAIAADRSAGEVLRMLNPVLIKMSEIIFKHGGTVDKFMGDSIMALFGVPSVRSDDVARALSCAGEMQVWMCEYRIVRNSVVMPVLYEGITHDIGYHGVLIETPQEHPVTDRRENGNCTDGSRLYSSRLVRQDRQQKGNRRSSVHGRRVYFCVLGGKQQDSTIGATAYFCRRLRIRSSIAPSDSCASRVRIRPRISTLER